MVLTGPLFLLLVGLFIALIGYCFWLLWRSRSDSYLIIDSRDCPKCGDKDPNTTDIFVEDKTWYWLYHCQVCGNHWYFADKTIAKVK